MIPIQVEIHPRLAVYFALCAWEAERILLDQLEDPTHAPRAIPPFQEPHEWVSNERQWEMIDACVSARNQFVSLDKQDQMRRALGDV